MREQRDFDTQGLEQRVGNNNQWVKLRELIRWESFRSLVKLLDRTSERGGRPPYDSVRNLLVSGDTRTLSILKS
jgi:hypothetical protein